MGNREKIETALNAPREIRDIRLKASFPARVREPTKAEIAEHKAALKSRGMEDDGGTLVPVLISTTQRARDGHIIEDWDISHFVRDNPVVLWAHDRDTPAVGRSPVVKWDKETGELRALAQFASRDVNPFGWQIGEMVRNGYLHSPSVGWDTKAAVKETNPDVLDEFPWALRILMAELLEFSVVNVEADTASGFGRAVDAARADGMDLSALHQWAVRALDEKRGLFVPKATLEKITRDLGKKPSYLLPNGEEETEGRQMSKEEFMDSKIPELISEGNSPSQAFAIAAQMWEEMQAEGGDEAASEGTDEEPRTEDEEEPRGERPEELIAAMQALMGELAKVVEELKSMVPTEPAEEVAEAGTDEEEARTEQEEGRSFDWSSHWEGFGKQSAGNPA